MGGREDQRLRAMAANEAATKERVLRLQRDPMLGRKNISGTQGYNMISHAYDATPNGAYLEHHDNMIRYKSKVRSANIAVRNHLGFNPVLGEQTYGISLPPPPRSGSSVFDDDARSSRSSTRSARSALPTSRSAPCYA